MAPELLDPSRFGSNGRSTRESDCYALGMVIYEVGWRRSSRLSFIHPSKVLTGFRPFHRLHAYEPVTAVLRGQRPEKPLDVELPNLLASPTNCGGWCSCVGANRAQLDRLPSSCPTTFRRPLLLGLHLQCTLPVGSMPSAPPTQIHLALRFENIPELCGRFGWLHIVLCVLLRTS